MQCDAACKCVSAFHTCSWLTVCVCGLGGPPTPAPLSASVRLCAMQSVQVPSGVVLALHSHSTELCSAPSARINLFEVWRQWPRAHQWQRSLVEVLPGAAPSTADHLRGAGGGPQACSARSLPARGLPGSVVSVVLRQRRLPVQPCRLAVACAAPEY